MTAKSLHHALPSILSVGALLLPLGIGSAATRAAGVDVEPSVSEAADARSRPVDLDRLTLITGDLLDVETFADGRLAVSIEPADRGGESSPEFHQLEFHDDLYVVPGDAHRLVSSGVLDRELFNVSKLAEYDYRDGTPVIVEYDGARQARQRTAVPGTTSTKTLASIDAVATTVDPSGDWWEAASPPPGPAGNTASQVGPLAGVDKVWLDEQIGTALDESVPQIGAPAAWAQGYDGTGVAVAVLDTGIDSDHPDLAGKVVAEANFSDSTTTDDRHGHGTHVASTVAGDGAASEGQYTGVAPGATLMNGKVLGDFGSGAVSDAIAGMEWAAQNGADVVNLSLGVRGFYTDGTDPGSQAVNQLTQQYGTLFVIAAGNDGPRESTVTTPGAADAALTVGAVDKSDLLAGFSSRGPRAGDFALKPDVTAPGVDIVAARAGGTSLGTPIDENYTSLNGTSMATPHVAGAAAILRQQRPGWTAQEIKDALASTGEPGDLTVFQQGGGRVDLARAVDQDVYAASGSLSMGYFPYPHTDSAPVTRTITYRNLTGQDVTLDLAVEVTDEDGNVPADGMLGLGAEAVTVPAGGAAEVAVTVDPAIGAFGLYGGYVTASGGDVVIRTGVGFYKESERYDITVQGIAHDGDPAALSSFVDVTNVDDIEQFNAFSTGFVDGTASVRVPPGTYNVMGGMYTYDESTQPPQRSEFAMVGDPELEVTKDTTVVLDGREANPVSVDVRTHDAAYPQDGLPNVTVTYMRRDLQGVAASHSISFPDWAAFAAPTEPVSEGALEFSTRHILTDPEQGFGGPFLFDAEYVELATIPDDLSYVVDEAALEEQFAQVENDFHANAEQAPYAEFRHHWRPYQVGSAAFARHFQVPLERTDFVSANDSRWELDVLQAERTNGPIIGRMFGPARTYAPGERVTETWFRNPFHPTFRDGVVEGQASLPSVRAGDVLDLLPYPISDSEVGHSSLSFYFPGFETAFRLYQDDALLASDPSGRGDYPVNPGPHEFRLELDTTSTSEHDWARRSVATHTAWTVQSPGTTAEPQVLPLLHVDYDIPLDLRNRLTKPGASWLDLHVRHQIGAEAAAVEGLTVAFSTDDGKTWQDARVVQNRGNGDFRVSFLPGLRSDGDVSIKVSAWDGDDNRLDQEIIRAFGTHP